MNKNCIRIRVYCFLTALLLVKVLFCRIKNSQIWCQFWRAIYASCECSLCMIFMDRKFVLLVLDCVKNKEPVKVIKIIFKLKIACIEFKLAWLDWMQRELPKDYCRLKKRLVGAEVECWHFLRLTLRKLVFGILRLWYKEGKKLLSVQNFPSHQFRNEFQVQELIHL